MNTPFISLETAFKVIDEIANEYDVSSREGKDFNEKLVGKIGLISALRIKKSLISEAQKRERSFD